MTLTPETVPAFWSERAASKLSMNSQPSQLRTYRFPHYQIPSIVGVSKTLHAFPQTCRYRLRPSRVSKQTLNQAFRREAV